MKLLSQADSNIYKEIGRKPGAEAMEGFLMSLFKSQTSTRRLKILFTGNQNGEISEISALM
jgi:hypothetical protein